jgi:hypothetical protein
MPFPTAITAGQQTQLRQKDQTFKQFLAVTPFRIVWQAEVNEALTSTVYDEFEWVNESGSYGTFTDVKEGMAVFITDSAGATATDFKNPVVRGRARTSPNATTFFINKIGTNISTSQYVTVIEDYDLHERNQETDVNGNWLKDSAISYSPPPPYVSDGLQSTYIDYSGDATVTLSFAPTITPTAAGATIVSQVWDVDDGTITVGTSTDKDITVQFPGFATNEHRWVRLEFTDSNGVSYYFVFEVFTTDITDGANSDVLLFLGSEGAATSGSWVDGFSSSKLAYEDVSGVLPNTRCTLFSVDWYAGTTAPIVTNIQLVGRLRAETTAQDTSVEIARESNTNFTIEGFAQQLGRLGAPPLAVIDTDSPADFTQMTDPTPRRAIMYALIWHSTFASLCAVQFDSDVDDYVDQNFLMDDTSSMLGIVNQQARLIQAQMTFARSGEAAIKREVNYIPTADRSSVPSIFISLSIDRASWQVDIDPVARVSTVEVGGTTYNTTLKTRTPYQSLSPVEGIGEGNEPEQLPGILLKSDLNSTNARAAVQSIAGNHLTNMNPKAVLRVVWATGGYYWISPNQWQVYRFIIDAGENIRGVGYSSSDTWLCTSTSTSQDSTGKRSVTAVFEQVSLPGRAGNYSGQIIIDAPTGEAQVYTGSAYTGDPDNPLINYDSNDPDFELSALGGDSSQGPVQDAINEPPAVNSQNLSVPFWAGDTVSTANNTVIGEIYTITIQGDAAIGENWTKHFDFVNDGAQGWVVFNSDMTRNNVFDSNGLNGGVHGTASGKWLVAWMTLAISSTFIKSYEATYSLDRDGEVPEPGVVNRIGDGVYTAETFTEGIDQILGKTGIDTNLTTVYNEVRLSYNGGDGHTPGGFCYVTSARITGTGANDWGLVSSDRGDAFYQDYSAGSASLYPAGSGLLINGSTPSTLPLFAANHSYTLQYTGDGNPIDFKFQDGDYSDNDRVPLAITVTGPGMNPEVLP